MSAFTTDAGLPAVSSEDFKAALLGSPAPVAEQAAPIEQPAPTETPATPPAQEAKDTPATDPPATDPPKDELAELRARLAQMEEADKRREGQYTANVTQQREALKAAQDRAIAAEKAATELTERQAKAAEDDWNSRVADAERRIRSEADPNTQQWLQNQLRVAVQQHDAEKRFADAERVSAAAAAKEAQLAPVFEQLSGLQQQVAVKTFVDTGLAALASDGATNLATETGIPVEEVRDYLARPQIVQRLARALALTEHARMTGQPVPTTFQDLGEQIRDHFVDLAAARTKAEEKLIVANQRALAESGATRGDGGGGGTAPPREINTMKDVTTDDFARAMGYRHG